MKCFTQANFFTVAKNSTFLFLPFCSHSNFRPFVYTSYGRVYSTHVESSGISVSDDILDSNFTRNKIKEFVIHINMSDLLDEEFMYKQFSNLAPGARYSILTRVFYTHNQSRDRSVTDWKTLEGQIYMYYEKETILKDLITHVVGCFYTRLKLCQEKYNIEDGSILGLQILLFRIEYTDIVVKKTKFNADSFGYHKDLINVSYANSAFNQTIPLTNRKEDFGILLDKNVVDGYVKHITLTDSTTIDLSEIINKHLPGKLKIPRFTKDTFFYQLILNNIVCIVVVKEKSENNILFNIIDIYTTEGILKYNMVDSPINSNSFKRKIGNVTSYIDETGVYKKELDLVFDPVYPKKLTGSFSRLIYPDFKIGTIDLETYNEGENYSKVYAIGYHVEGDTQIIYIDEDLNSDSIIIKCFDMLLKDKYNGFTFYIHNFGRFDSIFLLKVLINANELTPNKYTYSILYRDKILSMNISRKINKKTYTIKLVDSYNILQSSLNDLCLTFNPTVKKTYFPYDFVNKNTLFYIGDKPDINYYKLINVKDSKNITLDEYESIPMKNWSVVGETYKYLKNDLESLFQIIEEFKRRVHINYGVHITKSLTISGLAMDLFLRKYYDSNIPLIQKKSVYIDIKNSYFGGITEVYKPYGNNLYYYDVNSLYPYSALNSMPGKNCVFTDNINRDICDIKDDMFGFYYCKIISSDNYIGLLPVRSKDGLTMPLGEFEGWYFSEELKFAHDHGYNIKVISGYKFDKQENVFNKYVEEFYSIKRDSTDIVLRSIAKSMLNNLLGRFALNIEKSTTELVSEDTYNELTQYKRIISIKRIGDKLLVTHDKNISKDICDTHDVDFYKTFINVMNSSKKDASRQDRLRDVSIAISSAVTSYSRIFMNKVKLDVLNRGGSIYYTDTDSIVTDIELDSSLVGTEIGKFKLEFMVNDGYFISSKTYCLVLNEKYVTEKNEGIIIKSKGVNDITLNVDDFVNLYNGIDIETKRFETILDYSKGSVTLKVPHIINLKADTYKKRTKIYKNNLWVDTKPLIIYRLKD